MNEKEKKQPNKFLERLKNIKHIEIYVAIIFIIVIFLIYLSSMSDSNDNRKTSIANELSITAYIDSLESRLENSLSNISGVSDVKVLITLDVSSMEVKDSQISMSKFPKIKGVLITANGVNNTANKMKVLHAVETVIDVEQGKIEILSSE